MSDEPLHIPELAARARHTSLALATVSSATKDALLQRLAQAVTDAREQIVLASEQDVTKATRDGLAPAKLKRLSLTAQGVDQLAQGLRQVAALPDPVGRETSRWTTAHGLRVRRVRCPLGVIAMIYEARPAVTLDAFALCFKAGSACILKPGKEAQRASELLAALAQRELASLGLPEGALTVLTGPVATREAVLELLQQDTLIDLVIPRGGEELIRWVVQSSRIPTIQHYKGVCHVYVDQHADEQMAERICVSAKTSAPATCNAAECILVHRAIADRLVPRLCESLALAGVQVRADGLALRIAEGAGLTGRASPVAASIDDFGREFLDLVVAMKVVASLDEAVAHIARYGSNHTEAIVTASAEAAADFQARVHASCVLHNASTRMNDGFALGLGAEIGISTSRLHAYGPMGLEELTTQRFVVDGDGHVR